MTHVPRSDSRAGRQSTHSDKHAHLLYVHPLGNPQDDVIPYGVVALMNSLECSVLGVYSHEVRQELLEKIDLVFIDVHWSHSMYPAVQISKSLRSLSDRARIILGGYTATIFARELVKTGVADYVVVGDAEGPFPQLVRALLAGKPVSRIPNLVSRSEVTPHSYALSPEDFDRGNYLSLEWFPTLWSRTQLLQATDTEGTTFPVVPVYKGCVPGGRTPDEYCLTCYGQPATQGHLMKRGFVARSAARVKQDLRELSHAPGIHRVLMFFDFSHLGPDYCRELFSEKFDLHLTMEPKSRPSNRILEIVAGSFLSVELVFWYEDLAREISAGNKDALRFVATAQRLGVRLILSMNQSPSDELLRHSRSYGFRLHQRSHDEVARVPPHAPSTRERTGLFDEYRDHSRDLLFSKLFERAVPNYVDAIAVNLGLTDDRDLEQSIRAQFRQGISSSGFRIPNNPIHQQIAAGADPFDLTYFAAPFAVPHGHAVHPIDAIPKAWLLASPEPLKDIHYRIGLRSDAVLELPLVFRLRRTGAVWGIAINFVSRKPDVMKKVVYNDLWKMCFPLSTMRIVRAGETLRAKMTMRYNLESRIGLSMDVIA